MEQRAYHTKVFLRSGGTNVYRQIAKIQIMGGGRGAGNELGPYHGQAAPP
jgi:hypothetical protein